MKMSELLALQSQITELEALTAAVLEETQSYSCELNTNDFRGAISAMKEACSQLAVAKNSLPFDATDKAPLPGAGVAGPVDCPECHQAIHDGYQHCCNPIAKILYRNNGGKLEKAPNLL